MSESAPIAAPAAPVDSAPAENSEQVSTQVTESSSPEISDIEEAVEAGEISQAEAQKMIKKFQLKVRGKTLEREIDLNDHEALVAELQLAAVAKQEMQSGAELRKAYQREMERLRSDPFSVLQELGLDPEELSTGYISKKIEEMKKSPEQLAQEKRDQELEEARAEVKRMKEEKEQEEMSKLNEQAVKTLNDEIDKAITTTGKLPNTPLVRKKIADSMLWAMNNGFGDVTAEDVVPLVKKEMQEELRSLYDGLDADALEDYIGRQNIDKMRKKRLATAKVPGLNDIKPTNASSKPQESKPAQKIKAKDLFRNMGK